MKFEPGKIRILLVEDHAPTATMMTAMLKALGFSKLTVVHDMNAATERLETAAFDLLLCDFNLGIANGLMLVRKIRRPDGIGQPNLPIVMVTAHAEPERVAEAQAAGIDDFLVKPVQPDTLLRCLTKLLERPRDFARSKDYAGPDRRRRQTDANPGRREADRDGHPIPRSKWIVPPKS